MKILTAIGKGELMMMMMQCDKLNRDEFICVCVFFFKNKFEAIGAGTRWHICKSDHVWWQYVELHL